MSWFTNTFPQANNFGIPLFIPARPGRNLNIPNNLFNNRVQNTNHYNATIQNRTNDGYFNQGFRDLGEFNNNNRDTYNSINSRTDNYNSNKDNYNSNRGNNNFFSKKRSDNSTPRNSNIRLGFIGGLSDPTSLGLFTTIGNKMFLYLSYEGSPSSTYEHYDNISFEEVMNWGDEQRDTFETYTSFSVGFGGEVTDKLSQFAGININTINKDLVFYDELLILSNNGEYSINDTEKTNFSLVYGLIFDMNKLSVGPSIYFLNRTRFNINLGFNF